MKYVVVQSATQDGYILEKWYESVGDFLPEEHVCLNKEGKADPDEPFKIEHCVGTALRMTARLPYQIITWRGDVKMRKTIR